MHVLDGDPHCGGTGRIADGADGFNEVYDLGATGVVVDGGEPVREADAGGRDAVDRLERRFDRRRAMRAGHPADQKLYVLTTLGGRCFFLPGLPIQDAVSLATLVYSWLFSSVFCGFGADGRLRHSPDVTLRDDLEEPVTLAEQKKNVRSR